MSRTTPKYSNVLAAQPLAELLERITGVGRGYLGVDLHRDGDLAVPQDLHRYARMHVESGQQGPACLAGAVHDDSGHRHRFSFQKWTGGPSAVENAGLLPPGALLATLSAAALTVHQAARQVTGRRRAATLSR